MGSSNFLAELVASRGLQPEPVATDALVRLFNVAPLAAGVLRDIAQQLAPGGTFNNLVFTGQVTDTENEGRPDIEGRDSSGVRLIVEAKFDAALTPPQESPSGYLNRLSPASSGALVFLVPANRMPGVWPQLLAGPGEVIQAPPPDLEHRDREWLTYQRPDGRVIAAVTWEALLSRLHQALDGGLDPDASSDLSQLDGLVRSQIRTGWVPIAPGDLSDRTGKQLWHLAEAVLKAARNAKFSKVTSATQHVGVGSWIDTETGWRTIRVGIHLQAWSELGLSPVWALVWARDAVEKQRLLKALAPLALAGGPGIYELNSKDIVMPIRLDPGLELGELASSIAQQAVVVSGLLDNYAQQEHVPLADDPAHMDHSDEIA